MTAEFLRVLAAASALTLPAYAFAQAVPSQPVVLPSVPSLGVTGVGFYANDFERSLHFFREGMGMVELMRLPQRDGDEVILSFDRKAGGATILLLHRPSGKPAAPAPEGKVVLAVPNADALSARLKAAGYAPGPITAKGDKQVKIFWVSDPDGNRFEIIERTSPAVPKP